MKALRTPGVLLLAAAATSVLPAQTQVLDVDAYNGAFNFGTVTPNGDEYVFRVDGGADNATIQSLSLATGDVRTIPTPGIDVASFTLQFFEDRFLVFDGPAFTPQDTYSVDFAGSGDAFRISPEPGQDAAGVLAPAGGHLAIRIGGDATATDASERDRLYTGSILGGPAVEVFGGVDRFQRISTVSFSSTGETMLVRTRPAFSGPEQLFLLRTGVAGKTPVLESPASNVRYRVLGSNAAGTHFVVDRSFTSGLLWSVPVADPTAATRLDERADGTDVFTESEVLDSAGNRLLYLSEEPEFNQGDGPRLTSLMSVPIDGSRRPEVVATLPPEFFGGFIQHFSEGPWDFVHSVVNFDDMGPVYAVQQATGSVVELIDPGGFGISRFEFEYASDGSFLVASDDRAAGNDLYLFDPAANVTVRELLDVSDEDRLVDLLITPDGSQAIVSLIETSAGTSGSADRILSLPLDGGPAVTLLDVRDRPVLTQIGVGPTVGPWFNNGRLTYITGDIDGQIGFYQMELPPLLTPGDYDGDGVVDTNDYLEWRNAYGDVGDAFAADGNLDGVIDAADYTVWRDATAGPTAAVPEPCAAVLALMAVAIGLRTRGRA